MPPPDADQEEDEGDEDDRSGHGNDDVQPQVELGALWYSARLPRIPANENRIPWLVFFLRCLLLLLDEIKEV